MYFEREEKKIILCHRWTSFNDKVVLLIIAETSFQVFLLLILPYLPESLVEHLLNS
jgi:hypothetical protein